MNYKRRKDFAMSFGEIIASGRKKLGLSQKDLAARIRKEDGTAISPQYLNDIEHDRRHPPSDHLLHQMAKELGLSEEYLHFQAGKFPEDLLAGTHRPEEIEKAFSAFRRVLKGK